MNEAELLQLDRASFRRLVEAELRSTASTEEQDENLKQMAKALRTPVVAARWHDTLSSMLVDVDSQLSAERSKIEALHNQCISEGPTAKSRYFEARREYDNWRAKAVRFKSHLLERKKEAREVVEANKTVAFEHKYYKLVGAVRRHRDATLADEYDPTDTDLALWNNVEDAMV